jgi:hypothetical protein
MRAIQRCQVSVFVVSCVMYVRQRTMLHLLVWTPCEGPKRTVSSVHNLAIDYVSYLKRIHRVIT